MYFDWIMLEDEKKGNISFQHKWSLNWMLLPYVVNIFVCRYQMDPLTNLCYQYGRTYCSSATALWISGACLASGVASSSAALLTERCSPKNIQAFTAFTTLWISLTSCGIWQTTMVNILYIGYALGCHACVAYRGLYKTNSGVNMLLYEI